MLPRIAGEIAREPHCWTLVLCPPGTEQATAEELCDELLYPLAEEVPTPGTPHVLAAEPDVVDRISDLPVADAALVVGLGLWSEESLRNFDLVRNRMVGGVRVVIVLEAPFAEVARKCLPNVWSLFGPRVWRFERHNALDVAARLAELRSQFGLNDDDLQELIQSGRLALDPPVVEWLALLGRGDLIRD